MPVHARTGRKCCILASPANHETMAMPASVSGLLQGQLGSAKRNMLLRAPKQGIDGLLNVQSTLGETFQLII